MPAPKIIALIEFGWSGHLPTYFRFYCAAMLGAGHRVIALCPRPQEMENWAREQGFAEGQLVSVELTDRVLEHYWVRKIRHLANAFRFRQCARLLVEQEMALGCKIDLVFFACLYSGIVPSASWMDRVLPYPWTGLLLDSSCVRWSRWRQLFCFYSFDQLTAFHARHCQGIATLDEGIAERLSQLLNGKPVHVLPELADDTPPAAADFDAPLPARIRQRAAGRRIVGCYGQFGRGKGALNFLQVARRCREKPWFFVWAGGHVPNSFSRAERRWIEDYLASDPPNCLIHLERVPDGSEYNTLVSQADVLFLCYQGHLGSSNTISKAAAFEKPILVSESYYMAEQTRRYQLGLCVPEDDLDAMEAALHRLLASADELPSPRYLDYRADHSKEQFTKVIGAMTTGVERPHATQSLEEASA